MAKTEEVAVIIVLIALISTNAFIVSAQNTTLVVPRSVVLKPPYVTRLDILVNNTRGNRTLYIKSVEISIYASSGEGMPMIPLARYSYIPSSAIPVPPGKSIRLRRVIGLPDIVVLYKKLLLCVTLSGEGIEVTKSQEVRLQRENLFYLVTFGMGALLVTTLMLALYVYKKRAHLRRKKFSNITAIREIRSRRERYVKRAESLLKEGISTLNRDVGKTLTVTVIAPLESLLEDLRSEREALLETLEALNEEIEKTTRIIRRYRSKIGETSHEE